SVCRNLRRSLRPRCVCCRMPAPTRRHAQHFHTVPRNNWSGFRWQRRLGPYHCGAQGTIKKQASGSATHSVAPVFWLFEGVCFCRPWGARLRGGDLVGYDTPSLGLGSVCCVGGAAPVFVGVGIRARILPCSRRKRSLTNQLMFSLSRPVYIGVFAGVFLETAVKETFALPLPGSRLADGIIRALGVPGCSVLIALAIIYALAFIRVARKDYRQMMKSIAIN